MPRISRFRDFIQSFTRLIDQSCGDEQFIFDHGKPFLSVLLYHDDWLPECFAQYDPYKYQQYLLYCDPLERFSVVSFIWGPGQTTPVHDHTTWGMVGMLRGAEICEVFDLDPAASKLHSSRKSVIVPGDIDQVSPRIGDIHRVSNALDDQVSVSIHVYGANIGVVKRHAYAIPYGKKHEFVSGYSNDVLPNIWV